MEIASVVDVWYTKVEQLGGHVNAKDDIVLKVLLDQGLDGMALFEHTGGIGGIKTNTREENCVLDVRLLGCLDSHGGVLLCERVLNGRAQDSVVASVKLPRKLGFILVVALDDVADAELLERLVGLLILAMDDGAQLADLFRVRLGPFANDRLSAVSVSTNESNTGV